MSIGLLRNQMRPLHHRRGNFDWAGPAHVFPVVFVFGATTNADLVGAAVG